MKTYNPDTCQLQAKKTAFGAITFNLEFDYINGIMPDNGISGAKNRRISMEMKRYITLACLTVALFLAGCQQPEPQSVVIRRDPRLTRTLTTQRQIVGRSVQNRYIQTIVFGQGPDTTLIIATIHGNETAGTGLVELLPDNLRKSPGLLRGRRVVIVPVANPDGKANNTRGNAHDVDLNRNFAADNRMNSKRNGSSPLSEPESRVIAQLISRYRPSRIIAIHQPLACIDYDGPGRDIAERMALYCDLPVKKLGARPGSLGSYAGEEIGIPIITFELRRNDHKLSRRKLWELYGNALLAAVAYPERIEGSLIGE